MFVIGADNVGAREGISGSSTTAWNLVRLLGREKRRLMKDSKVLMNRGPLARSLCQLPSEREGRRADARLVHSPVHPHPRAHPRAHPYPHPHTPRSAPPHPLRTPSTPPPRPLPPPPLPPPPLPPCKVHVALVGVAVGNRVLAVREGECKDGDGGVVDDEDAVALLQVRDCIRRETAFRERLHSVRDFIL